jgi:hypothetical protein
MSERFYRYVGRFLLVLILCSIVGSLVAGPIARSTGPSALQWAVYHAIAAGLVTAIWAVLFRPQLEQGQLSLRSLFVLILLQAILFGAIRWVSLY